jgi:hypothetical protein
MRSKCRFSRICCRDRHRRRTCAVSCFDRPSEGLPMRNWPSFARCHREGSFYSVRHLRGVGRRWASGRAKPVFTKAGWFPRGKPDPSWRRSSKAAGRNRVLRGDGRGFGGAQRQANLNALSTSACVRSGGQARHLEFPSAISSLQKRASVGAAQTVTADVVRILTILNPRGLNFGVFVAGLGKRFNQ